MLMLCLLGALCTLVNGEQQTGCPNNEGENAIICTGFCSGSGENSNYADNQCEEGAMGWIMGAVTHMNNMFNGATTMELDFNEWDVSSVQSMEGMFHGAIKYNGNMDQWNVHSVTNMNSMFRGAFLFNKDISAWGPKLESVTDMRDMFKEAASFNQDISSWDVSAVIHFHDMFSDATEFRKAEKGCRYYLTAMKFNESSNGRFCEHNNDCLPEETDDADVPHFQCEPNCKKKCNPSKSTDDDSPNLPIILGSVAAAVVVLGAGAFVFNKYYLKQTGWFSSTSSDLLINEMT